MFLQVKGVQAFAREGKGNLFFTFLNLWNEKEIEFGIRQYDNTGICKIFGDRDKDTTVSSASSLCGLCEG